MQWLSLIPLTVLAAPGVSASRPRAIPIQSRLAGSADDHRALAAADLVRLRDIGPVAPDPGIHIFALSPDGKRIAFQVREADPVTNSYHLTMYVLDLDKVGTPIVIDRGGELIRKTITGVAGVLLHTGFPTTITPEWSLDGKSIYFLKRTEQNTAIWKAAADGSGSARVTDDHGDIDDFTISDDGNRMLYSTRVPDPAKRDQLRKEGLGGYRYDARFIPLFANKPIAFPTMRETAKAFDLRSNMLVRASTSDESLLAKVQRLASAPPEAWSSDKRRAWVVQRGDVVLGAPAELYADDQAFHSQRCAAQTCSGAESVWWTSDGKRVRFIRREGWGDSLTAIYEWTPGSAAPVRLYATEDLLVDCQPAQDDLICLREQSTDPRHVIRLNLKTGAIRILYDPNPNFHALSLGMVKRLHWRNEFGVETFGDLVYPVNYKPGRRYPLIVVQYITRGFLRGGTGDEFPIQAFANRGYAALSIQRPSPSRLVKGAKSRAELEQGLLRNFKDRRNVLSSIESEVKHLIYNGIVDRNKVGITGLSDGSSTVQFAEVNSRLFKAGSVSGCCWEPYQDVFMGPAATADFHQRGWPSLIQDDPNFWSRISLVKNARTVAFPLLMQQSDDEFRAALASFTALKEAGKPVALYVFPHEYHVKWQPAHRLAAYERNLQWFDFWLRGKGEIKDQLGIAVGVHR